MDKRYFALPTPKNRRVMEPERKPFFKRGEGLHVAKLRSSERWQRLREMILSEHPLCSVCGRVAEEVHHIKEAVKHEELFFDYGNLAGLCEECHAKVHGAMKRGIEFEQLIRSQV